MRADDIAYHIALFVHRLLVDPAGTPHNGDLSDSDRTPPRRASEPGVPIGS